MTSSIRFESLSAEDRLVCGLKAIEIVRPEVQRLLALHNQWPETCLQFYEEVQNWLVTKDEGTSDRVLALLREKIHYTGFGTDEFDVAAMRDLFKWVGGLLFAIAPVTKYRDDPRPDRSDYLKKIQHGAERLHKLMNPDGGFVAEWHRQCKVALGWE
jgi:hypothetical protein